MEGVYTLVKDQFCSKIMSCLKILARMESSQLTRRLTRNHPELEGNPKVASGIFKGYIMLISMPYKFKTLND